MGPGVKALRRVRPDGTLVSDLHVGYERARNAVQNWNAGIELYESYPDLVEPTVVAAIPVTKVRELLSGHEVSQRHGPEPAAWSRIAGNLASGNGSTRRMIDLGFGDSRELLADLKAPDEAGRPRFPMLGGPKVGPMWVRMLANPGGAKIDRVDTIPVAVRAHVRCVTKNLGVTKYTRSLMRSDRSSDSVSVARSRGDGRWTASQRMEPATLPSFDSQGA